MKIALVIILSIILRVLFLDKENGLWYDEITFYTQASADSISQITSSVLQKDFHFPLYHIILGFWMKIFGNSDFSLRFLSVVFGVSAVIMGFFTGKEVKNERLGLIFASLLAVNGFLIYYSQEVRFYSFLTFLSTLALYGLALLRKGEDIKGLGFWTISNLAICYTYTVGVFFTAIGALLFALYLFLKNKELLQKFIIANFAILASISPLIIFLIKNFEKLSNTLHVFNFDGGFWFVILQNYFSPLLTGIYNNPVDYKLPINIIMIIIYVILIYIIIRMPKKRDFFLVPLGIGLGFILILVFMTQFTNFKPLTRHTILALPCVLFYFACKIEQINANIAFWTYIVLNLTVFAISPYAPMKLERIGGYKAAASLVAPYKPTKNDAVIYPMRTHLLDKYLPFEGKRVDIINDLFKYGNPKTPMPQEYKDYLKNLDAQRIFLIVDKTMSIYNEKRYEEILKNDELYEAQPKIFMRMYKINRDTIEYLRAIKKIGVESKQGDWEVYIFKG